MRYFLSVCFLLLVIPLFGQPGSNSYSFNTPDNCDYGTGSAFGGPVITYAMQPDGKILVGGAFNSLNGQNVDKIVRRSQAGLVDDSFNTLGFNGAVTAIIVRPDNKIWVAGDFDFYDGDFVMRMVLLNSDGTLDPTFDAGMGFDDKVRSIAEQSDGKIVVVGDFSTFDGGTANGIVRLNPDGSEDIGFNSGTGFNSLVETVVIQPDGKIIVLGHFTTYNGSTANKIVRLNQDGTIDSSFITGSGFGTSTGSSTRAVVIQPDGKIVVGGAFFIYNGTSVNSVIRLNSDGSLDGTFLAHFNGAVRTLQLQMDGEIICAGNFTMYNSISRSKVARLLTDGALDLTFDPGDGFDDQVDIAFLQPDGKILISGIFESFDDIQRIGEARLNSNGSLDLGYAKVTGFNEAVASILLQPDNKTLVFGSFTQYNDMPYNSVARLNFDGSPDTNFAMNIMNGVSTSCLQPDGKIIIGGGFTYLSGFTPLRIARLNSDGTYDPTFVTGSGCNNVVYASCLQADGKVIIAGSFTTYNGVNSNRIVRLNPDGSHDASFIIGTGFNGTVYNLMIQPDGKILVIGSFTSFNGSSRLRIARLNTDGSLDLSFIVGSGFDGTVYAIEIQPDGKLLAGGSFNSYAGNAAAKLVRLNNDGSFDATFGPGGTGIYGSVRDIDCMLDGQIIVTGNLSFFNGSIPIHHIIKLNPNGSLNSTFDVGTGVGAGFDGTVYCAEIQSDGNLIVGGGFSHFNGTCRNRIARLYNSFCNTSSILSIGGCDSLLVNGQVIYTSGTYMQCIPNTAGCDSLITVNATIYGGGIINTTVTQNTITLTAAEILASTYQWLDCDNSYLPIPGETAISMEANTTGNFAVQITKSGCIDTSICIIIDNQDFYDSPDYISLSGEVFAFPVSTIDTCDAEAIASGIGGIFPYQYDWFTQANNNNTETPDSLCEGFHILKITDNIGDTALVDYYVTDTANFYYLYDTILTAVADTAYLSVSNCSIDYSLPLDSAAISQLSFISAAPVPFYELYFVEVTYYQGGDAYVAADTIWITGGGNFMLYFSVYCPTKSFSKIKTCLLHGFNPTTSLHENSTSGIMLYPNPTTGLVTLKLDLSVSMVEVYTPTGEKIFQDTYATQVIEMDLSNFSSGVYFIKVLDLSSLPVESFILIKQ